MVGKSLILRRKTYITSVFSNKIIFYKINADGGNHLNFQKLILNSYSCK